MKTTELFEDEGEWRLQLRKEMTKFNQQFGIYLRNSTKFNKWDKNECHLGGDYEFGAGSDGLGFTKEQRFALWKKAYANKIKRWVDSGYEVQLNTKLGPALQPDVSEAEILEDLEFCLRPTIRGSDKTKWPLEVYCQVIVTKPERKQ